MQVDKVFINDKANICTFMISVFHFAAGRQKLVTISNVKTNGFFRQAEIFYYYPKKEFSIK